MYDPAALVAEDRSDANLSNVQRLQMWPGKLPVTRKSPVRSADIKGVSRLAIDATLGLTRLVETMHQNIASVPGPLGRFTQEPARGIAGLVYRTIQGTTRLVGSGIELLLNQLAPLLTADDASSGTREAILAALNGVLGDHLEVSENPLAIRMQVRCDGLPLELTAQGLSASLARLTGKLLLMVHGLCMNDLQWRRHGHDHGESLARTAGFTPIYLHYNSGRHISSNGHALADLLELLLSAWPVPVEQLTIVGHSMGGLVARSACHYGRMAEHAWMKHLRQLAFLGTPHLGAPLERGGNWINRILEVSPYTAALARLAKIRSAGITDLRHGSILDEDWLHGDRFARARGRIITTPLPRDVECFAVAATLAANADDRHFLLQGDGLVPLDSALGRHKNAGRSLNLPAPNRWIGYGMNHMDLLDSREVCTQLGRWLG